MRKIKNLKIICLLLPFLLMNTMMSCSGDSNLTKQPAAFNLQAGNLFQAFSDNESESNQKYVGKILAVVGTVKGIETGADGTMVLKLETNSTGDVQCNFIKETPPDISKIKVGESIQIKGICSGFLFDVMLDKCVIGASN